MRDVAIGVVLTATPLILFFVILRVGAAWLGDRKLGGKGQYRLFRQAMKSNSTPAGADRAAWLATLRKLKDRRDRQRWPAYIPAFAVLALIVAINVAGVLRDGTASPWEKVGLTAIIMAVLTTYIGGSWRLFVAPGGDRPSCSLASR